MASYWAQVLDGRINRRRALTATGGAAVAAALLAACGGDKSKTTQRDQSGLLSKAVDTANKAVPGGVWSHYRASDIVSIDPNTTSASSGFDDIVPYYSLLLKYGKSTTGRLPPPTAITGDAAESWELSPGGTRTRAEPPLPFGSCSQAALEPGVKPAGIAFVYGVTILIGQPFN